MSRHSGRSSSRLLPWTVLSCLGAAALALSGCSGNSPNPRSGYVLTLRLASNFDSGVTITGLRIVLDSLPSGPALNLQPGAGETIDVSGVSITSRRTDADGDGEVEVVYEASQNPWASAAEFSFPLRSPGHATTPFLLRVEVLAGAEIVGKATVDRTTGGKALDFDLGDPATIPTTVACVPAKSCTGEAPNDGGVSDAGTPDAGSADGGTPGTDGGAAPPTGPLALTRDSNGDGTEDTLAVIDSPDAGLRAILTADEVGAFRWAPGGQALYVVRRIGAATDVVSVPFAGGTPTPVVSGGSFDDVRVSPNGARVAGRISLDGGARWMVRPTDGADGGADIDTVGTSPLQFSPDGTRVAVAVSMDGGTRVGVSSSLSNEVLSLLDLQTLVAYAFSPVGDSVAIVGRRAGETKSGLVLASTEGDPIVRLATEPMAGEVRDVGFSKDGLRMGFRADLNTAGAIELYMAAPAIRNVSGGVAAGGAGVGQWAFDPSDSSQMTFIAERRGPGLPELYRAKPGSIPTRLSADDLDGGVASFEQGPATGRVAYRTAAGNLHVVEPSGPPRDLGAANRFAWSTDERWIAVVRGMDLFLVSADGAQTLGPLTTGLVQGRVAWRPAATP